MRNLIGWIYVCCDGFGIANLCPKNISPAPSAIIFSLEGVFATIAAWILLSQVLDINNLFVCLFILFGVLFSQLVPIFKKN